MKNKKRACSELRKQAEQLHCEILKHLEDVLNHRLADNPLHNFHCNSVQPIDDGQCNVVKKFVYGRNLLLNFRAEVPHHQQRKLQPNGNFQSFYQPYTKYTGPGHRGILCNSLGRMGDLFECRIAFCLCPFFMGYFSSYEIMGFHIGLSSFIVKYLFLFADEAVPTMGNGGENGFLTSDGHCCVLLKYYQCILLLYLSKLSSDS